MNISRMASAWMADLYPCVPAKVLLRWRPTTFGGPLLVRVEEIPKDLVATVCYESFKSTEMMLSSWAVAAQLPDESLKWDETVASLLEMARCHCRAIAIVRQ